MVNPFKEVKWRPDIVERRKFARSLVIGFPVMAVVFLTLGWLSKGTWNANLKFALWLGAGGAAAGLIFWGLPQIARPFYVIWYFLACCIGIVVGNLLLAGLYYLFFTPAALLRRAFGKPALNKGFEKSAASYWRDVEPVSDPARYYRQF